MSNHHEEDKVYKREKNQNQNRISKRQQVVHVEKKQRLRMFFLKRFIKHKKSCLKRGKAEGQAELGKWVGKDEN